MTTRELLDLVDYALFYPSPLGAVIICLVISYSFWLAVIELYLLSMDGE